MKQLLVLCFLCTFCIDAFSQGDRAAYIKGFLEKEYFYFDSINKVWNKEINSFEITNQVYACFRVDTNSNIIDLQITELPIVPLPQQIKSYIKKLIESTNGKWMPQLIKNQKINSDEIVYRFDFLKNNQTMQESIDASSKIIEYYFDNGYNIEIVRKFDNLRNNKIFTILY